MGLAVVMGQSNGKKRQAPQAHTGVNELSCGKKKKKGGGGFRKKKRKVKLIFATAEGKKKGK